MPFLKSLIEELACEVIRKDEIQAALVRWIVNRLRPQFGTPASTLRARLAEIGDEERLEELVKVAVCQTIKDLRSNLSAFAPRGEKA